MDYTYIQKCLDLIELQFNRGKSAEWTTYDFEKLSEAILEKTGITLSVTTLKRIWGKLPYNNIPATTTLNTLAQFCGYKDWRDFKQEPVPVRRTISFKWLYWIPGLLCILIVVYLLSGGRAVHTTGGTYTFSSNKIVNKGVPNSVVFKYDATAAGTDSVFISQTWDVRRKAGVSKDRKEYSSIYYYPGYFRAKLIVGKQIVKEHDLMITSDGWVVTIDNNNEIPIYVKKEEYQRDKIIAVDEKTIHAYNLSMQPNAPSLRFFNVLDLGGIKTDSFAFETSVKSDFKDGAAVCQQVEVLLLCKNDVIIIPLCAKACIGDINLVAGGRFVSSKEADLSKFGCDLNQWVKLRVESAHKRMRFLVNGTEAYALDILNEPADLVGVQVRFHGVGAIKETRFIRGLPVIELF